MGDRKGVSLAFIWLIALACTAGGWFQIDRTLVLQGTYEQTAREHADNYRRSAAEEITRSCYPLATEKRAACIATTEQAARAQERQEYDLEAQRITAAWTAAMGSAAIIGMFVGIVGVALVWSTFRETRRQAQAAQSHLDLALVQAAPDVRMRANLTVAGPGHDHGQLRLRIEAKNWGQGSAQAVHVTNLSVSTNWREIFDRRNSVTQTLEGPLVPHFDRPGGVRQTLEAEMFWVAED